MKKIGCTGHRDLTRIAGFSETQTRQTVARFFQEQEGDVEVWCGLADGADMLFAEEALQQGISLVAVLPCEIEEYIQERMDKERFYRLIKQTKAVYIKKNSRHRYLGVANELLKDGDVLCVLWDGCKTPLYDGDKEINRGGTYDVIRLAKEAGKEIVYF